MADTPPIGPARSSFALAGRSVVLDPRTNAVRRDLADVRLASQVFAPHYAAPMVRAIGTATALRADRATDSKVLAALTPGEPFEVFELAGDDAWGIAGNHGLVGYIPADALEVAA